MRAPLIMPFIMFVLGSSQAIAKNQMYETDWASGFCAPAIQSYTGDRTHDVLRLRVNEVETKDNNVALELGYPEDGKNTPGGAWRINIAASSDIEKAELIIGGQKGGWVVFRDVGNGSIPQIQQNMFYPWEGECKSFGPKGEVTESDVPTDVVKRFRDEAARSNGGNELSADAAIPLQQDTSAREEGTFIKAADDFDGSMDRDEQVKAVIRSLPNPVILGMQENLKVCTASGAVNSTLDKKYVTVVDIDGDGDNDWISNDAHFYCIYPDNSLKSVGGQNSANISIYSKTTKGVLLSASLYTTAGVVRQYKGLAVYAGYGTGKTPDTIRYVQIRKGRGTDVTSSPDGGKIVYQVGDGTKPRKGNLFAMLFGGDTHAETDDPEHGFEDDLKIPEEPRIAGFMRDETTKPREEASISQAEIDKLQTMRAMMPVPLLEKLAAQHEECTRTGGASLTIDDKSFVTKIDMDGDGDQDYIADQTGLTCEFANGRKRVMGGDPSDGRTLWLLTTNRDAVVMTGEEYIFNGVIRRHANFTTIESFDFAGRKQVKKIRGGVASEIVNVPPGGTAVYEIRHSPVISAP